MDGNAETVATGRLGRHAAVRVTRRCTVRPPLLHRSISPLYFDALETLVPIAPKGRNRVAQGVSPGLE